MAITRREFMRRSALVGAAVTAPHPLLRAMLGAGGVLVGSGVAHAAPSDAILVLLQLEGGNDGLNTVIPSAAGLQRTTYDTKRPNLGVPLGNLAATGIGNSGGTALALHPTMTSLKTLFDAGKVAVVNGVGYPNQNLSHFRSRTIWPRDRGHPVEPIQLRDRLGLTWIIRFESRRSDEHRRKCLE